MELFKVKWVGWDNPSDDTWEPLENLSNCMSLVADYEAKEGSSSRARKPPTKGNGKNRGNGKMKIKSNSSKRKPNANTETDTYTFVKRKRKEMPTNPSMQSVLHTPEQSQLETCSHDEFSNTHAFLHLHPGHVASFGEPWNNLEQVTRVTICTTLKKKTMMGDNDESQIQLKAEQIKLEANNCYKQKDYKQAQALYSRAIEIDPENATYYANRAAALTMLKDYNSAINDCRKAISLDILFLKAYSRISKCYMCVGNIDESVSQLVQAEQVCKESPSLDSSLKQIQRELLDARMILSYYNTALQHFSQQEYLPALQSLEQIFSIYEPTIKKYGSGSSKFKASELINLPLYFRIMRAQCLVGCKEYTEANIDVQKILYDEPRNSDALTLRAHIGYIIDAYTLAQIQQLLTNALAYDPDNSKARSVSRSIKALEALRSQGNDAFGARTWDEAERVYTECVAADTDGGVYTVKAYSNRATVRSKTGQYDGVISDCTIALKKLEEILFPTATDVTTEDMSVSQQQQLFYKLLLRRADAYMKQEKYEEAVRDLQSADAVKPGDNDVRKQIQQANKLLKMSKRKDWYKILSVDRDAGENEIKKAYRKLALLYHPDKQAGLSQEEKDASEIKFRDVKEAYDVLSDPRKKNMFDQGMDVDASGPEHDHFSGGGGMQMDDMMKMFFAQQQQQQHSHGFGGSFGGNRGGFSGFDF